MTAVFRSPVSPLLVKHELRAFLVIVASSGQNMRSQLTVNPSRPGAELPCILVNKAVLSSSADSLPSILVRIQAGIFLELNSWKGDSSSSDFRNSSSSSLEVFKFGCLS